MEPSPRREADDGLSHARSSGHEHDPRLASTSTSPRAPQELHRHRRTTTPLDDLVDGTTRGDDIHELGRGQQHVFFQSSPLSSERRLPIPPRPRSFPSTSSSTSYPPRMSSNPTYEVAGSLRVLEYMSPARSSGSEASVGSSESMMMMDHDGGGLVEEQEQQEEEQNMMAPEKMDNLLPENDGMSDLRLKFHEIRNIALSTEEKAKRMHALMTETYRAHTVGMPSPVSLNEGDGKFFTDEPVALEIGLAAMPIDPSNPYNLRPGDLEPSFSPLAAMQRLEQDTGDSMEDDTLPELGCVHYLRNVKVQCFDCHRWFPCRHCHDQSNDLPYPHSLRRKLIRNMLCMLCQTPQPAAEACMNCLEWAADYYCPICKLWDNDPNKSIYHCDDCGICRLGKGLGKDFVHCKKCNVCISISTSAAHPCVEGATEGDCPLCLEEMFASREKVVSLPCGHYMHAVCYKDLMAVTYKCPVCSKSAVNMELQWRKLDDEIQLQPMPDDDEELDGVLPHVENHIDENHADEIREMPPLQQRRPKTVWIGCNDCGGRCWTAFHWLGLKCRICDSYNTNQMAPTAGYETEAERLIRQQQVHRQHDFTGNGVLLDAGIGAEGAVQVDSLLDVPSSPSLLAVPASPGSPSSTASSPRRYFVQDEETRRPSFTVPRFSTPTLPTLANLPEMPRLPRMPNIPQLPHMPTMPNLPHMPNLPNMPQLPNMAEFGLPRFSPYDMFDSLSRSLSPMRYYLQGQDMQDEQLRRDANRSPTSVHSDPTPNTISTRGRKPTELGDEAMGGWTSGSANEDSDGGVDAFGDEEDDEDSDTDSEEFSDAEIVEDGLDIELPGHR